MHHTHVFATAEVRKPLLIPERATQFLKDAIAACGMRVIAGPYAVMGVVPGNEGVSAVAILDYSSASVHEWPDRRRLDLDVYTCGWSPSWNTIASLFADLEPSSLRISIIDREELLD